MQVFPLLCAILLGAAMAIQENGITSIDWFAMLKGWEMARS